VLAAKKSSLAEAARDKRHRLADAEHKVRVQKSRELWKNVETDEKYDKWQAFHHPQKQSLPETTTSTTTTTTTPRSNLIPTPSPPTSVTANPLLSQSPSPTPSPSPPPTPPSQPSNTMADNDTPSFLKGIIPKPPKFKPGKHKYTPTWLDHSVYEKTRRRRMAKIFDTSQIGTNILGDIQTEGY